MVVENSRAEEPSAKPRVFVGSSVESLDIAYAVQENLEYVAEITVWTQGIFELTRSTLNSLLGALNSFDFAIFVFTPDDILKIRNETVRAVRDNVVFELGLFMGELGEDRTFIIVPRGNEDLHLPTDLAGITPATYDPARSDQNITAALEPTCTRVRRAMQNVGVRQSAIASQSVLPSPLASGLSTELRQELAHMLKEQEERIEQAFDRFAHRISEAGTTQRSTAKAPLTRMLRLISDELSPSAKALLFELARRQVHLTSEQYQVLRESGFSEVLEELRRQNLVVPLSGFDANGNPSPIYWFPPGAVSAIQTVIGNIPPPAEGVSKEIRDALQRVAYLD